MRLDNIPKDVQILFASKNQSDVQVLVAALFYDGVFLK